MLRSTVLAALTMLAGGASAQVGLRSLPGEFADVRWMVSSKVVGDFACGGGTDTAIYGVSNKSGFVVMIQAPRKRSKPYYLMFPSRGRDPKTLSLEIEDLDFGTNEDVKREVEVAAPGLKSSKTCKGLSLGDGETDSHHIYWDLQKKTFSTWSR